jgi:hypothetical protein
MSEQNPTAKGPELIVVAPICPHCGRKLPGMNILSMELPTPRGGMLWLLPSCPFVADENGKAADGGEPCGRIITAQWTGQYTPPKIALPGYQA